MKKNYNDVIEPTDLAEEVETVPVKGVVVNCDALRVRADHKKDATVIATILAGQTVVIKDDPIDGFYNVTVEGLTGWCMKEFIKIQ